jgi:hypothetical protein
MDKGKVVKAKKVGDARSVSVQQTMANYSSVFQQAIDDFESPIVPSDQGDAGKGQVTARAGYIINSTMDDDIGYISKQPGQTQYYGIAVDAIHSRADGSGADYLTDVDLGNGTREIRVAYTPYATPPPGTPITNWTQPTEDFLNYGGPLTLKSDGGGTDPIPTPTPPADNAEVLAKLDQVLANQGTIVANQNTILANQSSGLSQVLAAVSALDAFIRGTFDQIEDWLNKFGKVFAWWKLRGRDDQPEP